jgi:hypothetical protein
LVEGDEGQDLAEALGAAKSVLGQALTLYIPSRDGVTDEEFDNSPWVREAAKVLAQIGRGYTIMPPSTGGYLKLDGTVVEELVTLVYAYIEPDLFEAALPDLRESCIAWVAKRGRRWLSWSLPALTKRRFSGSQSTTNPPERSKRWCYARRRTFVPFVTQGRVYDGWTRSVSRRP